MSGRGAHSRGPGGDLHTNALRRGGRGGSSVHPAAGASSSNQMVSPMPEGRRELDWQDVSPEYRHHMQRGRAWYSHEPSASGQSNRPEAPSHGNGLLCHPSTFPILPSWSNPEARMLRNIPAEQQPSTLLSPPTAGIPAIAGPAAFNTTGEVDNVWNLHPDYPQLDPFVRLHSSQSTQRRPVPERDTVNTIVDRLEHQDEYHRASPRRNTDQGPPIALSLLNNSRPRHDLASQLGSAAVHSQQPQPEAPETQGERHARRHFESDFTSAPTRTHTSSRGSLCAWEALVRSWDHLRSRIVANGGNTMDAITPAELDQAFLRARRRGPEFEMGKTDRFRVDQMAAAITHLLLERFNIRVQMGYVVPHRGQEYFAVLVPWNDDLGDPNFRLWVYNSNVAAEDWRDAHFEGLLSSPDDGTFSTNHESFSPFTHPNSSQ